MTATRFRLIALCAFPFLCVNVLNAQTNFMAGYYVTTQHDTVRGFIMNRAASANFFSFLFKSSAEADPRALYPDNAESFTIANAMVFKKYTFKQKDVTGLTGFFKLEVQGKLTLLSDGRGYFALTDKGDLHEVTSRMQVSGTSVHNRIGFGTLKALMKDCSTIDDEYLTKEYSDKNLKKIFVTYNECVGNQTFVSNDIKAKTRFNIGLQALPSITTMNAGYPMNVSHMAWSKNIAGGIFVSAFIPGAFEKMRVMLEANYYQYSGSGHFSGHLLSGDPVNSDVSIKYKGIQVPLFVRVGNRFFADIGIQNHLTLNPDIAWRIKPAYSSVFTEYNYAEAPRLWTTGLLLGGGMKFNIQSFPARVFLRYSRNGNPFFSDKPGYQMASIGLSLQLTRN